MAKTPTNKPPATKAAKTAKEAPRPSLKHVDLGTAANAKEHIKATGAVAKSVYMVPLEHIHIAPGFNVRVTDTDEYKDGIVRLSDSIIQHGFYNTKPLSGYVGKLASGADAIFVTDGHRRFEAAKNAVKEGADVTKLPVILKPAATTGTELTVALLQENEQSKLTMMEKAIIAKRLMEDMSKEEVAKELNCQLRYVDDLLLLVSAPKAIRALVTSGVVKGTLAVKELRADKAGAEEKLVSATRTKPEGAPITEKDFSPAAPGVKMSTVKMRYALAAGDTAPYVEIERFKGLFADQAWYEATDREGTIRATEPFEIVVTLRRPKKVAEIEADGDAVSDTPKKRGRPKKAVAEPVGEEVDPMTMTGTGSLDSDSEDDLYDHDDDDDEKEGGNEQATPNLRDLGIADPSDPADGL